MIKILFVCLGNICRSPMAEFVMKNMVAENGLSSQFFIDSAGTNYDCDDRNFMHYNARGMLQSMNVPFEDHYSRRIRPEDYERFDYIIAMDDANIEDIQSLIGKDKKNQIHCLLDWTANPRNIKDPWFTGNFDETYWDIVEGCQAFLEHLKLKGFIG